MLSRPDGEAAWINWFRTGGFEASTRMRANHVDGMIRVSRVAGERQNMVLDRATILVECWHSDSYEASQLAHQLSDRAEDALDGTALDAKTRVSRVVTTGPLEFPDPSSTLVRYQFTLTCLLRRVRA